MRTLVVVILALAMTSAGCATPQKQLAACSKPLGDGVHDAEYKLIIGSVDRVFGKLPRGYHVIVQSRSTDEHGNLVMQLVEIRPAAAEQTPGGERLTVVADPCSYHLIDASRPT